MASRYQRTAEPDGGEEKKTPEKQTAAVHDDTCRCKEASEMTPRELLRLMFSDLAFWKRSKKE